MEELVSVVIPVYNAEKYIVNCVNAVQRQIYKNLEIILVDDGSKDESGSICDCLAKKDSRIRVIHKQNGGVSTARNKGVEAATGKYLMFADSDDMPDSHWVSRMVELSRIWNVNFVICSYRLVYSYHEAVQPICHSQSFEPVWAMTNKEFFDVIGHMMAYRDTMFAPWNKLFLTQIVKEHQIKFPEDIWYGEDFLFTIQYLKYCSGVIETRERLYNYIIQNPDSLEAKYKPDLFENQTRLYNAAKNFLIQENAYGGHNVYNLSSYYTNRVIVCIKNQFVKENTNTELETRKYIESFFENRDVIEAAFIADLHNNEEQSLYTDLIKAKQYDKIYDAFKNMHGFRSENPGTVRYKVLPETVWGWRWIPYTFKSLKKYGFVITWKRIVGKLNRKLRRK